MAKVKIKKLKKIFRKKKKFLAFLYPIIIVIIFLIVLAVFLFFHKTPVTLYVYPENPKQGDTVFIRVKSDMGNITGSFADEKLVFYKRENSSEWVSFLGIDADHSPGKYKIYVKIFGISELSKEINIGLADFSYGTVASAPSSEKTGVTTEKAVNNLVKNDNPAIKKALDNFTSKPYFNSSFSFPLSTIKRSGFSFGKFIEFTKYKLQHFGVDLKADQKTDIYAVNDGKIVLTANLSNYGKTIIIDHGLNIFSMYLHLEEFKVSEGDIIKKGKVIGLSGDTGYSTAPHLHFSVRVGASRVDPIAFIETTKKLDDSFILADITNAFLNVLNQVK